MRQNVCRRLSAARRRQKYEPGFSVGRSLRALLGLPLLLLLPWLLLSLWLLSLRFSVTSAGDCRPARLLPEVWPILPLRVQRGRVAECIRRRRIARRIILIIVSSGRTAIAAGTTGRVAALRTDVNSTADIRDTTLFTTPTLSRSLSIR